MNSDQNDSPIASCTCAQYASDGRRDMACYPQWFFSWRGSLATGTLHLRRDRHAEMTVYMQNNHVARFSCARARIGASRVTRAKVGYDSFPPYKSNKNTPPSSSEKSRLWFVSRLGGQQIITYFSAKKKESYKLFFRAKVGYDLLPS